MFSRFILAIFLNLNGSVIILKLRNSENDKGKFYVAALGCHLPSGIRHIVTRERGEATTITETTVTASFNTGDVSACASSDSPSPTSPPTGLKPSREPPATGNPFGPGRHPSGASSLVSSRDNSSGPEPNPSNESQGFSGYLKAGQNSRGDASEGTKSSTDSAAAFCLQDFERCSSNNNPKRAVESPSLYSKGDKRTKHPDADA